MICHDIALTGSICSMLSKTFKKKSIIVITGKYYEEIPRKAICQYEVSYLKTLEHISIKYADLIVSLDENITGHLAINRIGPIKTVVLFGLVDSNKFKMNECIRKNKRNEIGIKDDQLVLLFVGWLTEWDGADLAIDIYKRIYSKNRNIWLIMIGSGDLKQQINESIIKFNLDKALLLGYIPHEDINRYMMIGDLALIPLREPQCGIGNIPLELMSLGIPILSTDVGMLKKIIIDYKTGFIAKEDVIEELSSKILYILSDLSLLHQMGKNCSFLVQELFSCESMEKNLLSILDDKV